MNNPATGKTLAELPHASAGDLDEAVAAAQRAFPLWRATSALARSAIVRRTAALLRDRAAAIATVMTLEQGKPVGEAATEIAHAAELFEWYAEEGRRCYGRIVPSRAPGRLEHLVLREPLGVCAAFTPWNFPALTPARKLAGALAAGCTVILKASEETPGCAVAIMQALHDAELPTGCAQLVFGVPAEVSEHLIAAPAVRKVSFTGSTPVGKHLMALAAAGAKRTIMELGGNAPVIVFSDADYDAAVATISTGKVRNAGQVCVSPARFFRSCIARRAFHPRPCRAREHHRGGQRAGRGHADGAMQMGPLTNARRLDAIKAFVADAERAGGTGAGRGQAPRRGGSFLRADRDRRGRSGRPPLQRGMFRSVLPVMPFATVDKAMELANGTSASLAAYAFTRGIDNAQAATHGLRAGMVGVNTLAISTPETPFGGVGESGFGSEGGINGLDSYLDTKLVSVT